MVDTASALCDACRGDAFHHLTKDRKMCKNVSVLSGRDFDHYLLLYACSGKCVPHAQFWAGRGADLNRASFRLDSVGVGLVVGRSFRHHCLGDTSGVSESQAMHVERFQQKRRHGRLSPERHRRKLFVAAALDSRQRCVRAWLVDRCVDELCGGSDTDSDGCILEGTRAAGVGDDVLELLRPAGTKPCRSPLSEQELQVGAGIR